MACVDIGAGQGMELVRMLRESCSSVELLLIVDENTPPMSYVRPGVMPSGLIQRGALTNAVLQSIEDFVSHALVGIRGREDVDCFVLETKEELLRIPYASILCFESRSKRISVRLQRNEYAYYDTLDRLQQSLPSSFVRCHRSFIVNMSRVLELQLSKNHIRMDDNTIVPVSRSYKSAMRERFA
jgi:DNA-binding LytR/AlgR family response regulator